MLYVSDFLAILYSFANTLYGPIGYVKLAIDRPFMALIFGAKFFVNRSDLG
jgi:hypothetical protein